jgi:FkbM family methyltransferase
MTAAAPITAIERGPFAGLFVALGPKLEPWSERLLEGSWERPFAEALKMLAPGHVLYDVGAHIGLYSVMWLTSGGRMAYAFEPLRSNLKVIEQNSDANIRSPRNAIIALEMAATNRSGTETLFSCSDTLGLSSMSALRGYEGNLVARSGRMESVKVQTTTIDDLLRDQSSSVISIFAPPDVIKIDVEGAEARVVAGAMQTIQRYHPTVFCELHHPGSAAHLANVFRDLGYTMNGLGIHGQTAHVIWIPNGK